MSAIPAVHCEPSGAIVTARYTDTGIDQGRVTGNLVALWRSTAGIVTSTTE